MNWLSDVFTADLARNLLLVIIGVAVTGFLVSLVKARLDRDNARRQKILEADLTRQKEFIDAQIAFLSKFSDIAWKMMFEVFKVSYAFSWEEKKLQDETYDRYGPVSWELFTNLRASISVGTRLTSPSTHKNLMKLYDWFTQVDDEICTKADDGAKLVKD